LALRRYWLRVIGAPTGRSSSFSLAARRLQTRSPPPAPVFPQEAAVAFIPTRLHGAIDYLFGLALIILPFGVRATGPGHSFGVEYVLPIALGIVVILYSLLTDYEMGLLRWIPFPAHLAIDLAGGVLLVVSPWLFGFSDVIRWPHMLAGLVEILVALTTRARPYGAAA
jgi:hypothetical protein